MIQTALPRPATRMVRGLAVLGAIALLTTGCGGAADGSASTSAASSAAASGSPAPTTDATTTEAPSTSAAPTPAPIAVTPPAEAPQLPSSCTYEGAYRMPLGGANDPALPERDGAAITLTATEVTDDGSAVLLARVGESEHAIEPAHVGDTVAVDGWTLSVTSVCADAVEVDLIN